VTAGLGGAGAAVLLLVVLLLGSMRDVTHSRSTDESPLLRVALALSVTGHFACTYTIRIRPELMRPMSEMVTDFSLAGCVLLSPVSLYALDTTKGHSQKKDHETKLLHCMTYCNLKFVTGAFWTV